MSISNAILRGVSGAYILQSGYGKLGLPNEAAAGIQGLAATGIPAVADMDSDYIGEATEYDKKEMLEERRPKSWLKSVSAFANGIGGALLAPFIPSRLAGLGLGAFSAGLLAIYFRNPAMTQDDGIRPSQDGTGLSKDLFLAAIAGALVFAPAKKRKKAKNKSK